MFLFVMLLLSQSDMYSIGVLALELFQPFGTEMERVRTLGDLREGNISDSFCRRWPVLSKFIMKLTNKEPSVRPTASQLLQSELFCSKDIVRCLTLRKTNVGSRITYNVQLSSFCMCGFAACVTRVCFRAPTST